MIKRRRSEQERQEMIEIVLDSWLGEKILEKGEQLGEEKGQNNILKALLRNGFEASSLAKITGINEEYIWKLRQEIQPN